MKELVSVEWLNENIALPNLVILDASPKSTVSGSFSLHENSTIGGARFFDLKENFADKDSEFPNTVPSPEQFQAECQKLGINKNAKIVVFDNLGIYTSPRVWWLFKIMGHEDVSVLNGGLPEWISEGYSVEPKVEREFVPGDFEAKFDKKFVKSYTDIIENLTTESFCVVDARSEGRFNGTEPEPRKHLQSGSIKGSVNIPYQAVLKDGKYKSPLELRKLFSEKEIGYKELVFSCGSGLTACIVMLAGEMAYKKGKYIYDGSWTEWAELQNLKETE